MSTIYTQQFMYSIKNQPYKKAIDNSTHVGESENVACGDSISLSLLVQDGAVKDVGYKSDGCAVSAGAMSILAEHMDGKKLEDTKKISWDEFLELLGVDLTPSRQKCARVAYDALVDIHAK